MMLSDAELSSSENEDRDEVLILVLLDDALRLER